MAGLCVRVFSDNTTALACIRRQGSLASPALLHLAPPRRRADMPAWRERIFVQRLSLQDLHPKTPLLECWTGIIVQMLFSWIRGATKTVLDLIKYAMYKNYQQKLESSYNLFLIVTRWPSAAHRYLTGHLGQVNASPMIYNQGFLEVEVPSNIVDEATSEVEEAKEDSLVELRCGAEGYPSPHVTFRREDGKNIGPGSNVDINVNNVGNGVDDVASLGITTGVLTFRSVSRDDMGRYLCIANNTVPPIVSKRIVLNVRYREPSVQMSHQMIGVFLGDDVAINCTVTAYPRPVVLWQDSTGKIIVSGGRYRVVEKHLGDQPPVIKTTLVIHNVTRGDLHDYHCNASIYNDRTKEKSLSVKLNEIPRTSLPKETPSDLTRNGDRGSDKKFRHAQPQHNAGTNANELVRRYEKPINLIPTQGAVPSNNIHQIIDMSKSPEMNSSPWLISICCLFIINVIDVLDQLHWRSLC
ncbi:unnamed protein product, partial [Meganyctiphanes norvegica]